MLKLAVKDKAKIGNELYGQIQRAKQLVGDKAGEAAQIRDEGTARGADCERQRGHLSSILNEIEVAKSQRAENYRTIASLNELNDAKIL